MRMSLRAISSMLCSEALLTITPPIGTGSKLATGRQCAGAADVGLNVENARGRLARLELVGDRPARRARDLSEALLQGNVVDFHDQAVDFVGKLVTAGFYFDRGNEELRSSSGRCARAARALSPSLESPREIPSGVAKLTPSMTADAVTKNIQRAFRRNRRVELL